MAQTPSERKADAAWDRIEALGGHGVWERDAVIVSLGNSKVTDEDLGLFRDFPFVEILDLSHTSIGDKGLSHIYGLSRLEALIVIDTRISEPALDAFRRDHPSVTVTSVPLPKGTINPLTGKTL
jgi:hypothetical protein